MFSLFTNQNDSHKRAYFFKLKRKRRRLEVEEYEFYQIPVKENSTNSNGNSQYIKAGITATVAVLENVNSEKIVLLINRETLKNFGSLRYFKTMVMRIANLKFF